MNTDCLFFSLLFCDEWQIRKCLSICKLYNSLNTTYLWELLCKRDWPRDYDELTSPYNQSACKCLWPNNYENIIKKTGYQKYKILESIDLFWCMVD